MMRAGLKCFAAILLLWTGAHAQPAMDAKESFESRQRDLVALADHLGTLHRLQQVCGSGRNPELYRARIQQIIRAEDPMGATRLDMIAAFNSAYRNASRQFLACDSATENRQADEARAALRVTERLYAPFR